MLLISQFLCCIKEKSVTSPKRDNAIKKAKKQLKEDQKND